jgi:hypothetical protein
MLIFLVKNISKLHISIKIIFKEVIMTKEELSGIVLDKNNSLNDDERKFLEDKINKNDINNLMFDIIIIKKDYRFSDKLADELNKIRGVKTKTTDSNINIDAIQRTDDIR